MSSEEKNGGVFQREAERYFIIRKAEGSLIHSYMCTHQTTVELLEAS